MAPATRPIEKIWKQVKYKISQKGYIADKEKLKQIVFTSFDQLADSLSWAQKWINDILNPALAPNYTTAFCSK